MIDISIMRCARARACVRCAVRGVAHPRSVRVYVYVWTDVHVGIHIHVALCVWGLKFEPQNPKPKTLAYVCVLTLV